jgi:hypothetical protein
MKLMVVSELSNQEKLVSFCRNTKEGVTW